MTVWGERKRTLQIPNHQNRKIFHSKGLTVTLRELPEQLLYQIRWEVNLRCDGSVDLWKFSWTWNRNCKTKSCGSGGILLTITLNIYSCDEFHSKQIGLIIYLASVSSVLGCITSWSSTRIRSLNCFQSLAREKVNFTLTKLFLTRERENWS